MTKLSIHKSDLEALDTIDAVVMNGDTFIRKENREELERFMTRWKKKLKEHAELEAQLGAPMCEECDEEMQPFASEGPNGKMISGFSCDSCGWSVDN